MQCINREEQTRSSPRHPASLIGSIGKLLGAGWFSNIQRAQLKRYRRSRGGPGEMVALQVLAVSGCPIESMDPGELSNWIWLVHCMAFLSGPGQDPHSTSSESRPGRVFQKAGYNDFRLRRLLDAREETFHILLERAIRRIARFGGPLNWSKLAPLILPHHFESAWAEHARIEIARDYAVAVTRSNFNRYSAANNNQELLS
ncbi:MAG: type I-E CRISPR-associated protein Cse2/CasB [Rhodomicrobium sp.]